MKTKKNLRPYVVKPSKRFDGKCPDCGSDAIDDGEGTWYCPECGSYFEVGD